ncbi:MAG: ABC transporter ATP-binding protein [Caldisericaceae bacterium]
MRGKYLEKFVPYFKKYKWQIIIAFVALIIASALSSFIPLLSKKAIDDITTTKSLQKLFYYSEILVATIVLLYLARLLQIYVGNLAGQNIMKDLRKDLFKTMENFEVDVFTKEPSGKIITRITNDVENMNDLLNSGLISLLGDVLFVVFAIGFLFYLNPRLALIATSPLPVAVVVSLVLGDKIEHVFEQVRDALTKINIHMQESLSGLTILQSFNDEEHHRNVFAKHADEFKVRFYQSQMLNTVLRQFINLVSYISNFLLIIFGGLLVINGKTTIGTLLAFLSYLNQLYGPLGDLSDKFSILQNAFASMSKIGDFVNENKVEDKEGITDLEIKGDIMLRSVAFSYNGTENVLNDVSMEIKRGEKAAIVGFTGAGKSTIANLILGFYSVNSGNVEFDGIDIKEINKTKLRQNMAIVQQSIFIFRGTVRENITLGREDFSDESIIDACKKLGVHDLIMKLEKGYDTELISEGKNISFGERQLISFVRALIYNPKILILDEATASIDTNTEELIEKGIKTIMEGRTSVVIAHRLSTIRDANKIYVINKGRIVEQGKHSELMRRKGLYYELYTTQFKNYK